MFKPVEIIFAPTSRCNLACAHCRVRRVPDELKAQDAIAFLDRCSGRGIERVGFSGGEPFLRPEFLYEVTKAAVSMDLYFDRLMTNGVCFDGPKEREGILAALYEAGFDGTLGVSADAYHAQAPEELAEFFLDAFRIWGRRDCAEILSVRAKGEGPWMEGLREVAARIGGALCVEDGEPSAITDALPAEALPPAGERLEVPILRFPYSASAEEGAWGAGRWFRDDYCEGPGNVFYVHPDGSVAVCCGFANENPSLIVGNIRDDDYESLMRRAGESAHVRLCYETGLGKRRAELEAQGVSFPGRTEDVCFFCDYLFHNSFFQLFP